MENGLYSDKLIQIANELEKVRKEIYVYSKDNKDWENRQEIDDELFSLQSKIRNVVDVVQLNEACDLIK